MSVDVEVVNREPQPAVAVRVVVPMDQLDVGAIFGSALGRLFPYLGQHGLTVSKTGTAVAYPKSLWA